MYYFYRERYDFQYISISFYNKKIDFLDENNPSFWENRQCVFWGNYNDVSQKNMFAVTECGCFLWMVFSTTASKIIVLYQCRIKNKCNAHCNVLVISVFQSNIINNYINNVLILFSNIICFVVSFKFGYNNDAIIERILPLTNFSFAIRKIASI